MTNLEDFVFPEVSYSTDTVMPHCNICFASNNLFVVLEYVACVAGALGEGFGTGKVWNGKSLERGKLKTG